MAEETQEDPKALKQARFFLNLIKSGEVWPEDEWDKAREAYEGDAKSPQRANLWRSTLDTSLAFQLQLDPTIRIGPAEGFEDERSKGRAACDEALVKYLWREMGFLAERLRAVKDARIVGLAFVRCCMDLKRMLPAIKHIDPEQVRVDPTCKGKFSDASWLAFYEYVSPDLLARNLGLDRERLSKAAESGAGSLEDPDATDRQSKEIYSARSEIGKQLRRVRLWRLFLRNGAALYDKEPAGEKDEEAGPHLERFRDKEGMTEPRRYVELVEGYDGPPLVDKDAWPEALALDYDAWPLKRLAFNEAYNRTAGFSDYRHLKKAEEYLELAIGRVNRAMGMKHVGAIGLKAGDKRSEQEIKGLLEKEGLKVVAEALGPNGEELLKLLFQGQSIGISPEDVNWVRMLHELHDLLSGVPKVKQGAETDYKTATEAEIASEAATARTDAQLRMIEAWDTGIIEQIQAMAHVMLQQLTQIEIVVPETTTETELFDAATGQVMMIPQTVPAHTEIVALPWAEASRMLTEQQEAQLVSLGVEAMVGPKLAQWWVDNEPLSVVRRSTTVTVERGSTQRRARERRVLLALELFQRVLAPIYQQTGRMDLLVRFARVLMDMQGLTTDFGAALPDPQEILAQMQAAQEAQAAQSQQQTTAEAEDRQFKRDMEVEELRAKQPVGAGV